MLAVSGQAALEEYLRLILPVKRVLRTVFESRLYQYFVAAAPGLKELMSMGKIWYEERGWDEGADRPRWDLLVVDTPATGHSLQYLRMPRAARDTFGEGLIRSKAEQVVALISDPHKTAVNLVALPEELSVSETLEAYEHLVADLGLPLGVLFVNRLRRPPVPPAALAGVCVDAPARPQDRRLAEQVLARARTEASLGEAQQSYLRQLQALPLPLVPLPFCFAEEFGLPEVEHLSSLLVPSPAGQEDAWLR